MFKAVLLAGIASLPVLSPPVKSAEPMGGTSLDLEPAINGAVSATGLFPSQVMEDAFAAYLHWTRDQGISRLVAFESMLDGGTAHGVTLPTQRMTAQFEAYMSWVDEQNLSPFYAFTVSDFD
jgi:hypothetical protein